MSVALPGEVVDPSVRTMKWKVSEVGAACIEIGLLWKAVDS